MPSLFAGGVLAPGIEISMDALFARAARLPKVPFTAPERVISQTTTAALQSGLVYGFAGQVDAIVDRIRDELGAPGAPVVATGGLAVFFAWVPALLGAIAVLIIGYFVAKLVAGLVYRVTHRAGLDRTLRSGP